MTSISPNAPPIKTERLLRARDVGELLGLHQRTVYRMAAAGELPQAVKVGGATRWKLSEITQFMDELQ